MKYSIPIHWQAYERFEVDADSLEEAVEKVLREFLKTPDEKYLQDSFLIDDIIDDEYPNETFDLDKILESL